MTAQSSDVARQRSRIRSQSTAATVLAIALLAALLAAVRAIGGPEALWERFGLWAPALSFPLHVAVNVSPIADLIPWAIANGAVYGLSFGALLNWVAWIASSSIQFAIGRRAARGLDLEARMDQLPSWLARYPAHHPLLLTVGRWLPFAGVVVNVGAGAFGVSFRRLLICATIGSIPPAIFCAGVGAGLLRLL